MAGALTSGAAAVEVATTRAATEARHRRPVRQRAAAAYICLVFAFLLSPLVVVVVFSFNAIPRMALPITDFSLRWYRGVFGDPEVIRAIIRSAVAGLATAVIAGPLGIAAALGLQGLSPRTRSVLLSVVLIPIMVPGLLLAIALALYYREFLGIEYSLRAAAAGHVLIALPFVAVLALRDLPAWLSSGWFGRGAVRLTLVASLLAVYPLGPQLIALYDWVLYPPTYKYNAPAVPARPLASGVAFERATPGLSDEPFVTGEGTGPMRKFLDDASALRRLVGERPTFVHSAAPYFTGLVYFMADLTPAPYLYDVETMLLNDRLQTDAWTHFERILPQVECVIVSSTDAFEARRFLSVNPAARVITHPLGAATVYVIMSGGPDQP